MSASHVPVIRALAALYRQMDDETCEHGSPLGACKTALCALRRAERARALKGAHS